MIIYFDGGCKPNPGAMEIAVVSDCGTVKIHKKLSTGTNNEAEWQSFMLAVDVASKHPDQDIEIMGDSKLVIEQFWGRWKINVPAFKDYKKWASDTCKKHGFIKVTWIGRKNNLAGIYIEEINK